MASADLGKVIPTYAGEYSSSAIYDKSTIVIGTDGQTYITTSSNVSGISPGVTTNWQNYWQILSKRGPAGNGIVSFRKTLTSGLVDTYTVTFSDGTTTTVPVTNGRNGANGATGPRGATGVGITGIEQTSTSGLIDTYRINYSDGTFTTFTVTNGRNGTNGANGTNGRDGAAGVGITSIVQTSTSGLIDTYRINYSDGTFSTFTVTNGRNGTNGRDGADGAGVPTGGSAGQVLAKNSATNYDTKWITVGSAASSNVANNLSTSAAGYVLDARQGKALNDKIALRPTLATDLVNVPAENWITGGDGSAYVQRVESAIVTANSIVLSVPSTATRLEYNKCNVAVADVDNGSVQLVATSQPSIRLRTTFIVFNLTN